MKKTDLLNNYIPIPKGKNCLTGNVRRVWKTIQVVLHAAVCGESNTTPPSQKDSTNNIQPTQETTNVNTPSETDHDIHDAKDEITNDDDIETPSHMVLQIAI